jgi:hypothetical protein
MTTVKDQVRTLTDYDTEIISSGDYSTLEDMAKDEIADDVGLDRSEIDFTSGTAKIALRWLVCIFCKINVGEIGSEGYSIGEVETKDLNDQSSIWLNNYRKKRDSMRGSSLMGHVKNSRQNRAYGDDGDTTYGSGQ